MRLAIFQPADEDGRAADSLMQALAPAAAELHRCRLSMEVESCSPDLVIATDARGGKLTGHPWIGWMRQPPDLYRTDRRRLDCLLSHDGWLVDTDEQARFLTDILLPTGRPVHFLRSGGGPSGMAGGLHDLLPRLRQAAGFTAPAAGPSVDCIVRVGSRDIRYVRRCLESLAGQTAPEVGVVIVRFGPVAGLDHEIERLRPALRRLDVVDAVGPPSRSGCLWQGLAQVEAELFGMLDDDDALHPNHIASLAPLALGGGVACAGSVQVWEPSSDQPEEDGLDHRSFHGLPSADREGFLDNRMAIHSSAFLASSALLPHIGPDPELDFAEDSYLIRRLLRAAPLRASWRVSGDFHWRRGGRDNTAFNTDDREESLRRIADRERLDPVIARLRQGGPAPEDLPSPAWGQPAERPRLPALATAADVWALPAGHPLYIYGSGFGGRVVHGEVLKVPHLSITGFLDSRREGQAFGLPLLLPGSLPPDARDDAVVIIASEYVTEMTATLRQLGFRHIHDATPFIRIYTNLRQG